MGEPQYRVVLTGKLLSGFSREEVMASLARELQTSAANLVQVFEGGDHRIDDILGAHDASVLQRRLEHLGASARVDRVFAHEPESVAHDTGLHLPSHDDPVEAGLMHCPACGHAQLVAESCDECGVVFADYNREHATSDFGPISEPVRPAPRVRPSAPPRPRSRSSHARRDIHADANAGWRDEWVDDDDELPTEQHHVNLFMGMHSRHLVDACNKMTLGRRTRFKLSWVGGAVISPFLWVMHRKMWALGMIIFMAEILLPVVLITLGTKPDVSDKFTLLGLGVIVANRVFWPAILKSLYCRHARLTIMQMHRMSPTHASDIDIATRGGTSKTSVFVGIVLAIVVSLLTWSIVDTLYAKLWASGPVFNTPVDLPNAMPQQPKVADPVSKAQDDLLVNENRWVSTRNKLRVLGQRINTWFADRGRTVDPIALDIAQIKVALALEPEAILDGWGREIAFDSDGKGYRLSSAGPDGEFGSSDDVEYRRILER